MKIIFKLFLILTCQGHFIIPMDSTNVHPLDSLRKSVECEQQRKEDKTSKEGTSLGTRITKQINSEQKFQNIN